MTKNSIQRTFLVMMSCSCLFITEGCFSARYLSSIEQQSLEPSDLAGHKLKIVSVDVQLLGRNMFIPNATPDAYTDLAMERYPALFSREIDSLPVALTISDESTSTSFAMPLITMVLSLGTLPGYPFEDTMQIKVESVFSDRASSELCINDTRFKRSDRIWATVYTPLGLIPVPGHSDMPKISGIGRQSLAPSSHKLTMFSIIDAVVQAARECGMQTFQKVR